MKKIKLLLAAFCLFSFASSLYAVRDRGDRGMIERWNQKGTTFTAIAISTDARLYSPDGLTSKLDQFLGLPAPTTISIYTTEITTAQLFNQGTTFTDVKISSGLNVSTNTRIGIITQPTYPMALVLAIWSSLETATTTTRSTATLFGLNARGENIRESIIVTTTPIVTNNAFIHISSITYGAPAVIISTVSANMYLTAGTTSTYGLTADIEASSDVYKVNAWGGQHSSSFTVNSDFDTIKLIIDNTPTTISDFRVWSRDMWSLLKKKRN